MKPTSINRRSRLIISLLSAVGIIAGLLAVSRPNLEARNTACLWGLAFLYVFLFFYIVLTGLLAARLRRVGRMRKTVYALTASAISALILAASPLNFHAVVEANRLERALLTGTPPLAAPPPWWQGAVFYALSWLLLALVLLALIPWLERFFVSAAPNPRQAADGGEQAPPP